MGERDLSLAHTNTMRLVYQDGPEFDKKIRHHLKQTHASRRVDKTYINRKE